MTSSSAARDEQQELRQAIIVLPRRSAGRPSAYAQARYEQKREAFAADILKWRSRLEFAVSARGWGYTLEGEGAIDKGDIDLVERLVNECRKEGVLPLDICAEDAKRAFENVEYVDDTTPEEEALRAFDYCKSTAERYLPVSFWDFQDRYVQMLVEKIDVRNLFNPVCEEFSVPLANRGGWSDLNTLKYGGPEPRRRLVARQPAHRALWIKLRRHPAAGAGVDPKPDYRLRQTAR
jgi:hypothetical protein